MVGIIYICMYAYMFGKIESVAKKNTGYPRLSICRVFVLILDHGERYAVFFPSWYATIYGAPESSILEEIYDLSLILIFH